MRRTRTANPLIPAFAPVPRQPRVDGWTPDRQRAFIAALAATGSVSHAVSQSGMSKTSAYDLRAAPGASEFVAAWDAAVTNGVTALKSLAFDRAVNGIAVPVWHKGAVVGERRWFDNRLLGRLLTIYDRQPTLPSTPGAAKPEKLSKAELSAAEAADAIAKNKSNLLYLYRFAQSMRAALKRPGGLEAVIAYSEKSAMKSSVISAAELAAIREEVGTTNFLPEPWDVDPKLIVSAPERYAAYRKPAEPVAPSYDGDPHSWHRPGDPPA